LNNENSDETLYPSKEDLVISMDESQLICPGNHIVIRVNETTLSPETREFLKTVRPIGIHFGKDAFLLDEPYTVWLKQYLLLRSDIMQATGRTRMIWALDHEGGRVIRTPPPLTKFPYPLNWQSKAGTVGSAIGQELKSLGINLNFGPCLDIFSNPKNAVIGPRSFGTSIDEVCQRSNHFIVSLESAGVIATAKHFPGHGDTIEDSHFELPRLELSDEQLLNRELIPFIENNTIPLKAIMLSHILFPKIDEQYPASLSNIVGKMLLRKKLGYTGVAITDDLDMKAISGCYSPEQIAHQLLTSQINFALFNHSLHHAASVALQLERLFKQDLQEHRSLHEQNMRFVNTLPENRVTELPSELLHQHQELALQIGEQFAVSIEEFTGA